MKLFFKLIVFIMLLSPISFAEKIPSLAKWPKEMTKKNWKQKRSKSQQALDKVKEVRDPGDALDEAMSNYQKLAPKEYLIANSDVEKIDKEEDIQKKYDKILKEWQEKRDEFLEELKNIEEIVKEYRVVIGDSKINKAVFKNTIKVFGIFDKNIKQLKLNVSNRKLKRFQKSLVIISTDKWQTIHGKAEDKFKFLLSALKTELESKPIENFIKDWKDLLDNEEKGEEGEEGEEAEKEIEELINNSKDELEGLEKAIKKVDKSAAKDLSKKDLDDLLDTIEDLISGEEPDKDMLEEFEEKIKEVQEWIEELLKD